MRTPNRPALGWLAVGLVCGAALVLALQSGPATSAAGLATKVTRALKVAHQANKNAKQALAASKVPGPPGAPGAPGAPGGRGPSNAVASTSLNDLGWTGTDQTLATVPVVAGQSYVVTASTTATNASTTALYVGCRLTIPAGATLAQANGNYLGGTSASSSQVIGMTTAFTALTSGPLGLHCQAASGVAGNWVGWSLVAVQVGALN